MNPELKEWLQKLNNLPDVELPETITLLEKLLNFQAPKWDPKVMSKMQYINAVGSAVERESITKSKTLSFSELAEAQSDVINYVEKRDKSIYQMLCHKFRKQLNFSRVFNLRKRQN